VKRSMPVHRHTSPASSHAHLAPPPFSTPAVGLTWAALPDDLLGHILDALLVANLNTVLSTVALKALEVYATWHWSKYESMPKRSRSSLVSNPITCWFVTHWASMPRSIPCPQLQKTVGTFRLFERGHGDSSTHTSDRVGICGLHRSTAKR